MQTWLQKYVGFEIEVFYLIDSNFRDRGRLVDYGDGWLELHKPNGETMLIPTTGVRMAKVLGGPERNGSRLLRPAEDAPVEQRRK